MTQKKSTKKALLASVLSIAVCLTMLIGSTFAWFTDTDTAATSNIVAGTLDIEIVDENGNELDTLNFVDADGESDIIWEPGATFRTVGFQLLNKGNLSLKYKIKINNTEVSYNKLNEVIKFTLVDENGNKAVADGNSSKETATNWVVKFDNNSRPQTFPIASTGMMYIQGHMDENAGNAYQGLTLEGVSITVYATQDTVEKDMTDNQYDKDALYDDEIITVKTADEFIKAFANLEQDQIITLTNDINMTGKAWTPVKNKGFTLNGGGNTITGLNGTLVETTAGNQDYTIKNITFDKLSVIDTAANTENLGTAALISYADTCAYIMMENVTITNATITGQEYAAGFVAYTSGYGNDNDGPVNASHNFINCTIKNSTIQSLSDGSVGGLIAHAGSNPATTTRITDFTYENLSFSQAQSRTDKIGNMIGTANVGIVYINDADIVIADDIGRFVPQGENGKLIVNGEEIAAFDGK